MRIGAGSDSLIVSLVHIIHASSTDTSSSIYLMGVASLLSLSVAMIVAIAYFAPLRYKRVLALVLSDEPEQRNLILHFLVGTANAFGGIAALNYGVSQNVINANGCRWLSVIGLLVAFSLYVVLRSGLNKRMSKPSLAEVQMLCALAFLPWGYAIGGPGRPIALIILLVVMMIGMLDRTIPEVVRACVFAAVTFAAVMWHVAKLESDQPHGPQLQLVYFCALMMVLISIYLLTTQITTLRKHSAQHKKELNDALLRIGKLATRDELTGLYNRRHMLDLLNVEKQRCNRSGQPFSVCLIDIDYFKNVNDRYGHGTGDQVLIQLAKVVADALRETDAIARWGGEEFLILFTNTVSDDANKVLDRIHSSLGQIQNSPMAPGLRVTFSAGLTEYAPDELPQQTIARADKALYAAKGAGRNRTVCWQAQRTAA